MEGYVGYAEWGDVVHSGDSGSQITIARLFLQPGTYRVRPIHKAVKFAKYFVKDEARRTRTAIVADPDTDPVRKRHPELAPSYRYAMYVKDKADSRLKVMEFPLSVFKEFNKRYLLNKKDPGGIKDGGDWQITVTKTAGGQRNITKYEAQYIEDTPIDDSEAQKIKDLIKGTKVKLKELFAAQTSEDIERRLYGNWEEVYGKKEANSSVSGKEGEKINSEDLW